MTHPNHATAILLMHCPDQMGIVAQVTGFLQRYRGNIVDLEQHVAKESGQFFMRVEWELAGFGLAADQIAGQFDREIATPFAMQWQLHFSQRPLRLAIFVSKLSHCLYDILQRYISGEWRVEIPLIISNHEQLRSVAERYGIPFHVFPITPANKAGQEARELTLLQDAQVDLVVLARYMQVLTPAFISHFPDRIINIHHSFLPAFAGAKPYHQAFERGVKHIGATAHYVTEQLDEGPIISQDVVPVSHKDGVKDLIRKGRDLEKQMLSQALWLHHERRVLPFGNRTIIF